MKYKVIGWTSMDSNIEEVDSTYASFNAIVDHIKEMKYCFTGTSHQFHNLGCPVLNDGKKRTYSERTWGGMMADIHGGADVLAYTYAFYDDDFVDVFPDASLEIKKEDIVIDHNMSEEFIIDSCDILNDYKTDKSVYVFINDKFRYLDKGDYLIINNEKYLVNDVDYGYYYKDRFVTEEEYTDVLLKDYNQAKDIMKSRKIIIISI